MVFWTFCSRPSVYTFQGGDVHKGRASLGKAGPSGSLPRPSGFHSCSIMRRHHAVIETVLGTQMTDQHVHQTLRAQAYHCIRLFPLAKSGCPLAQGGMRMRQGPFGAAMCGRLVAACVSAIWESAMHRTPLRAVLGCGPRRRALVRCGCGLMCPGCTAPRALRGPRGVAPRAWGACPEACDWRPSEGAHNEPRGLARRMHVLPEVTTTPRT